MGLLERFTRDGVSKYVWGSMLLASILALVVAFSWGGDAVRDARLEAQQRAVTAVQDVLEPKLDGTDLGSPITGQTASSMHAAASRSILDDPRITRVRIWSDDGRLLFTTDPREDPGSSAALNDELLGEVAAGRTITRWNLSDTGGIDEAGRSLVRTYTPIRSAVAEVDHTEAGTVGPVRTTWLGYQIAAAIAAAIFLGFTILALRDPIDRINTGVPFAPSSVPAGYSLVDDERLHAVEEVYRLAHERVEKLEARLAESEGIRRRLEGDLQRTLTTAATGAVTQPITAVAPSSPAAVMRSSQPPSGVADRAAAAPPSDPAPVRIPEAVEPVTPSIEPVSAPAGSAASATAAPTEERPAGSEGRRRGAKRPSLRRRGVEGTAAQPAASTSDPQTVVSVPDSEVLDDAWAAAPAGALLARAAGDARPKPRRSSPDPTPRTPRRGRKPESSAAPPGAGGSEVDEAAAHAAALETFIRLTESDRQHQEVAEVDQGAVRAALARTAAKKKPGGARLQAHDERADEIPGGGPGRGGR
jgi:hypothetical protein